MSRLSREKRIEVMARLQVNGGNVRRTARECGVDRGTVVRCMTLMESGQLDRKPGLGTGGALVALPVLSLESYGDPRETAPLWYAVEVRTHQLLEAVLAEIAKDKATWTLDDVLKLAKVAQLALNIRTCKGEPDGGSAADCSPEPVVVVEYVDAPKRDGYQ